MTERYCAVVRDLEYAVVSDSQAAISNTTKLAP
jgi:hypothetical protein